MKKEAFPTLNLNLEQQNQEEVNERKRKLDEDRHERASKRARKELVKEILKSSENKENPPLKAHKDAEVQVQLEDESKF